jgi:hypothetical protein
VRSATLQTDELSVDDALLVCLDNKGKLDLDYRKTRKTTTDLTAQLKSRICLPAQPTDRKLGDGG